MDIGPIAASVALIAAGYLIGGIPFGIVVARVVGGPDPREIGSGRTGGANTARAIGLPAAIVAGLLDAAKGSASVLLALAVRADPVVVVLAGLAAIVGHSRSPYIGLRGGRGVAPAWGALLVLQPLVALVVVPVFAAILLITRISSLASLVGSLVGGLGLVAAVLLTDLPRPYLAYGIAGTAFVWLFHGDNIQRLLAGEERRIDLPRRGS